MKRWIIVLAVLVVLVGVRAIEGAIVFQHTGNNDPISEGWTQEAYGVGVAVGPVNDDLGQGINAWYVDDNSTAVYSTLIYRQTPTDAQIADANTFGWKLSTFLRVVDVNQPANLTVGVRYSDGVRRYGVHFGSDADGDPIVMLGEGVVDERYVAGPSYILEGAGSTYHLYELIFDPGVGSAYLLVDCVERISGYTGIPADTKRVFWGSANSYTSGHGNYNLVQWEIVPEPTTLLVWSLLGTLGIGLGWRRGRTKGAGAILFGTILVNRK